MAKLGQGPRFLRILWFSFVLSMTCLLLLSTALLIKDFLQFDVNVHIQLVIDNPSPFPALTVCHQPPFSYEAYKYWNQSKILSPSSYNFYMRQLTLSALKRNDVEAASVIWNYDSLSVYYQNLNYSDVVKLGHSRSIFLNCMRMYAHMSTFEDNCDILTGYRMRTFSHHQYLNCYTFEPNNMHEANETTFFSLIVGMGPRDRDVHIEQAFLPDIFDQARGLRVVIHEPGTMPDLEKNGIHVEPGKLNEINYEPVRWSKLNTPRRPCIRPNQTHQYKDLNETYNYTYSQCLLLHQQLEIMKYCQCIYVLHPRPIMPHSNLPYCGRLWPQFNETDFVQKINCLGMYLMNSIKQKYDGTTCLPQCEYYEFESTSSVTKWRAYPWQLYWLRVQNQVSHWLNKYQSTNPHHDIQQTEAFKMWQFFLNYPDLTQLPNQSSLKAEGLAMFSSNILPIEIDLDSEDFAYVVVKRKSPNTIEKTEKLVLSLYVLISRIGGLCSLTVGLTAAFLIELVEFVYLLCIRSKSNNQSSRQQQHALKTTKCPIINEANSNSRS